MDSARLLEHVELILDLFARQGLTCGDARRVLALVSTRIQEKEEGASL